MDSMDDDTVADALRGAGVALMKGSTSDSQREALKAHLGGCKLSVRETFDRIDEDKSGFLDEEEVEKGAAMLGAPFWTRRRSRKGLRCSAPASASCCLRTC